MSFFLELLFALSCILILHSYIIYPISLVVANIFIRPQKSALATEAKDLPVVSCITSVYNEADIIERKVHSVLNSEYPIDKIKLFIGSDASDDGSNELIKALKIKYHNIYFFSFNSRRGKTNVINDLIEEAYKVTPQSDNHIILFTDANVILNSETIAILVSEFINPAVAVVDSRIIQKNLRSDGISLAEGQYMSLETKLKFLEGRVLGCMMGAFGGCFTIRSSYLQKIPNHLIVDDFYITMMAMIKNGISLLNPNASCIEGIPNQMHEEFKRKSRISIGNFQNLAIFWDRLYKKPLRLAYAFFSHKFLRWIGPFLFLGMLFSSLGLWLLGSNQFGYINLSLVALIFGIPVLDFVLQYLGIHLRPFRAIRYFFYMNLALLNGFIIYVSGKQLVTWQPPKRSNIS
ncbi:MAG: glycosyltransferase [Saprospiraceae bacterium]|nr:glycosyltransferase [Saprospiraceae bacterium]MBK8295978.1 glycosyltransferase [Saprospiraceae bacterium]